MSSIMRFFSILCLIAFSVVFYMLFAQIGLGWVVIAVMTGLVIVLVFIIQRRQDEPDSLLLNRANRKFLDKDYQAALLLFNRVLERNPNQSQVYNQIATCYANLDQFEKALVNYLKVTELQPANADAFANLASIRTRIEPLEMGEVVKDLEQAWHLVRTYTDKSTSYQILLKIAFTELEIERYPRAIKACEESLAILPQSSIPRMIRGLCILLEYANDPLQVERGRDDLIYFLRRGFDIEVNLSMEVQYMLKAREFLLESGGLPEDIRPRIHNTDRTR